MIPDFSEFFNSHSARDHDDYLSLILLWRYIDFYAILCYPVLHGRRAKTNREATGYLGGIKDAAVASLQRGADSIMEVMILWILPN